MVGSSPHVRRRICRCCTVVDRAPIRELGLQFALWMKEVLWMNGVDVTFMPSDGIEVTFTPAVRANIDP